MDVGGVYKHELHCSLVLWFRTSVSRNKLVNICKDVLSNEQPIVLKGLDVEDFGSKSQLLVRIVDKNKALSNLHNRMLDSLQKLPDFSLVEPQFSRDNWRPHVTFQNQHSLEEGEEFTSPSVYLIEARGDLANDPKDVFAEVKFEHETTA